MNERAQQTNEFNEFLTLIGAYHQRVASTGRKAFRLPRAEAEKVFLSFGLERRLYILSRLRTELTVMEEASAAGESIDDTKPMLWRFLQKVGYTPCSDLMTHIEKDDVVELYSPDQIHLWQNLNFFDWISVELERVYCDTWYESTQRDLAFQRQIYDLAVEIFSGKIRKTIEPDIPWHRIEELKTELMLKLDIYVKVMSPVFQQGRIVGLIFVNACRSAS